jgi:hypothetical protein
MHPTLTSGSPILLHEGTTERPGAETIGRREPWRGPVPPVRGHRATSSAGMGPSLQRDRSDVVAHRPPDAHHRGDGHVGIGGDACRRRAGDHRNPVVGSSGRHQRHWDLHLASARILLRDGDTRSLPDLSQSSVAATRSRRQRYRPRSVRPRPGRARPRNDGDRRKPLRCRYAGQHATRWFTGLRLGTQNPSVVGSIPGGAHPTFDRIDQRTWARPSEKRSVAVISRMNPAASAEGRSRGLALKEARARRSGDEWCILVGSTDEW